MNLFDHLRHPDPSENGRAPHGSASRTREGEPSQCDEVEADITAYFDGEASDPSALRARRHLDACPACARMWRDWGDARLGLKTSRVPDAPASWPTSLVQRARLQALLPTLFASAPASLAHEDDFGSNTQLGASEAEVPPGLHSVRF
jgi:anti-sigma factor RsiW